MAGRAADFPPRKKRAAKPVRYGIAWWTERDDCLWLVRRPAKGLLGGMAALPGPDWGAQPIAAPALAEVRHVFTHFALTLSVVAHAEPEGEGWWQPLDRIDQAGLPTLYRKAVDAVLAKQTALAA